MASRRWISAVFLAAGSAMLLAPPAHCQVAPAPAAATAPDVPVDPQALVDRNLAELNKRLLAPAGAHEDPAIEAQRQEAARRLLSRPLLRTTQYLLQAMQNAGPAQLAVVRAIAGDPQPDPAFINPLMPLLGGERTISDEAARALARYGSNAFVRAKLIAFAQDLNKPVNVRLGVIRAMGDIVDRDVADALIALLNDPKQGLAAQNAAAEALARLTAETGIGRDGDRWKAWQADPSRQPAVWRENVLLARDNRLAHEANTNAEFINELKRMNDEMYERANQGDKDAMVMRMLNSSEPHVRIMGVKKVSDAVVNGGLFPQAAPGRIEDLIGDSDVDVRIGAAEFIRLFRRTEAVDALLAQVAQEPNIDAKIAQIQALAELKRLRVVPEFEHLLRDPSLKIAAEAAKAIKGLAPILRDQNPALARDVAAELWLVGNQRAAEPGGEAFRAATIEAAGLLRNKDLTLELLKLLTLQETARIRSAALRALGDMGDAKSYFQIAQWLSNEPDPAVRMDAIGAMGKTTGFEEAADTLFKFMSPNTEPDPAVRERAWQEFASLLPRATNLEGLNRRASDFQNEPTHRLVVLQALEQKYREALRWEDLAMSQQNVGATYMLPSISDPAKAAVEFEAALDYWQKRGVANQVTVQLVQQLFQALFAARDYDKAAAIAGKQIAQDRTQQGSVAGRFKDEVERLNNEGTRDNDPKKLKDALKLCEAALKIQPPLDERFLTDLRQYQANIQQKLKGK